MKHSKVLITGGAGFIGTNTARYFMDRGWHVTIFDDFSRRGTEHNLAQLTKNYAGKFTVVRGDVSRDVATLNRVAKKADAVIHLAAQVAATTSIENPKADFLINALGTLHVLEAVRAAGHNPPVLYSSTNKVYGSLSQHKTREKHTRYEFADPQLRAHGISETEQLDFHSPYGCSKGSADQYMLDYARIYGMNTVVFRQSSIYGPYQFGIEDQGWVSWFSILSLLGRKLTIYGTGKQVRDALFVEDLAALYMQAIRHIKKVRGSAFSVGGGTENSASLLELIQLLKKMDMPLSYSFAPFRPGDQKVFVSDNRKLKKMLGWKPTTSLPKGLGRMVLWQKENENQIRKFFTAPVHFVKKRR